MNAQDRILQIDRRSQARAADTGREMPRPVRLELVDVDDARTVNPRVRKKAFAKAVLEFPPVQFLIDLGKPIPSYRRFLDRCLPSWVKFKGIYDSFQEAQLNAPKGVRYGYDHEEIAAAYGGQTFLPSDYPALFWLREALQAGGRVFDFGGSVGTAFYSWQRYFRFPEDVRWLVCELPAVVRAGQTLVKEKKETRLEFTDRFEDAENFDFILMSGCLQYIEPPAAALLQTLKRLPRHLLINRIPLHQSREYVTLQNIRWMVSPYRILVRHQFIASLEALGYKLIDAWLDSDHTCWIPFYPEYSVEAYSGFYFRRD